MAAKKKKKASRKAQSRKDSEPRRLARRPSRFPLFLRVFAPLHDAFISNSSPAFRSLRLLEQLQVTSLPAPLPGCDPLLQGPDGRLEGPIVRTACTRVDCRLTHLEPTRQTSRRRRDDLIRNERRAVLRIVDLGPAPPPALYLRDGVDDDGVRRGMVRSALRSPDGAYSTHWT